MVKTILSLFFSVVIVFQICAQGDIKPVGKVSTSGNTEMVLSMTSIISALPIRNIGPDTRGQGYRLAAIAVYEEEPRIFYYASANGGVVKTTDGGKNSKFVFDKVGSASIGAVAVSQKDPDLVWVGTGDRWQRNSVGMGNGIFKSTDGGKSWSCVGLRESVSIGRIAIHPKNNDIIMVAAMGSPWGYGPDRGIFKTKDGGKTWKKVLFVDERSAGVDIIIDPKNPNNMLASLWDHIHRPWGYFPTGPGSGIFRSTDCGETWHRVSKGLPKNPMGRIAMDYFRPNPREVVAAVEAAYPATGIYRSHDGGETWEEMPAIHYDKKGKIMDQKQQAYWYRPHYNQVVRFCTKDVNTIHHGSMGHESKDGGKNWIGTVGDDHELWIDPKDPTHCLIAGDQSLYQYWTTKAGQVVEEEIIAPGSLFQSYGCGFDMRKLYWVMGNAQDGGGVSIPSQGIFGNVSASDVVDIGGTEQGRSMADPEDWTTVYTRNPVINRRDLKTGETFDPRDALVGMSYYQNTKKFEEYQKTAVKKRNPPREAPSFEISPWNNKTLYYGSNFLYKSVDKGQTWKMISPDLTHNKTEWQVMDGSVYENSQGITSYQAIMTIAESPLKQGMIWVGTDCGYVQLTMDDGKSWTNVTKNIPDLPDTSWTNRVYASRHKEGRAYIVFDNHRNFDLKPYVYVTEDYGKSWQKINSNLPQNEPCRVIQEGLKNPDLLFVGTEFGLWISLDRGKSWTKYQDNVIDKSAHLPSVAIHDLHIHPRELDLIIGTHGRGFWILPVRALEELTPDKFLKDVHFCTPGNVYLFPELRHGGARAESFFQSRNTQPGTLFSYFLKKDAAKNDATITVAYITGVPLQSDLSKLILKGQAKAGLNSIRLLPDEARTVFKKPGDYLIKLEIDGKEYYQTLHVEDVSDEIMAGLQK